MSIPALWKKTLSAVASGAPFRFTAGLRNTPASGSYCALHRHPGVEIIHHPTGNGTTCVAGRKQDFSPGSVLVHAPGEWHDQQMHAEGEDLCVQILLPKRMSSLLKQGFHLREASLPWLIEDIHQLSQTEAKPGSFEQRILDMRATAVLLELTRQAAKASKEKSLPPSEQHVLQAEQYIGRSFASIASLEEVARHIGITHDHLRHIYKKCRGESLVRHLGKVRVARAKTLLTSSPFPLKQIASLCGYRDEYYFSSAFRKLANLSPSQYRQRSRKDRDLEATAERPRSHR